LKNNLPTTHAFKIVLFITMSQFGLMFCVNVVMSFLPFYIIRVSPYTAQETMLWTGLIMGITPFIGAAASPLWGSLTAKMRPKALFQWSLFCNAVLFLLIGFTTNLPMLLVLRLIHGALLGNATIGLFMISEISSRERLAGDLSLFQNAITAGQLLGPPVGAYLAAHLGYQSPFFFSFVLIGVPLLLCQIYVPEIDKKEGREQSRKIPLSRDVLWGCALIFIATLHLIFLPSILPHVIGEFGLAGERALKLAGFIMMAYTASAIAGSYAISRLTPRTKTVKVIVSLCLMAALLQSLLFFCQGVVSFTVIRMLQTGIISAVVPLVIAHLASGLGGAGIGLLNSARFVGNGVGPLMATSVLAGSNLLTLYLLISGLTIGIVFAFWLTHWKMNEH
jgi:DHA1 family multidrug resistance protein-like MFS transporter